ncbi:MAG: hypothetical protein CEE38_15970 [Planctomycetes bacterium B3_Pla]|nr:MAG: hypothetical protein CEE38_15970 [Planctomycetes bacterium B3_Pla]
MLLLVVVAALIMTPETHGAVTAFDTEADYNAATGPQIFLINFDGNPPGGTLALGSSFSAAVTFGSPEASDPTQVVWNSNAITDAGSTTAPNFVGPMDGIFTDPVYAFALLFSSAGEAQTVSLYDEGAALIDTVIASNPSGFFGVVSDTPVKSFFIDNGNFPDGTPDRFFIDDFRANEPLIINVSVDIKPGSCPNPFNAKNKGSVPVAIVGAEDFDATTIDPDTITLAGVSPLTWAYEDSTQPEGDPENCYNCFDADDPDNLNCDLIDATDPENPIPGTDGVLDSYCGDGFLDLVLHFDAQELADAIGEAEREECVVLELVGLTLDGVPVVGSDSVVIKTKIK